MRQVELNHAHNKKRKGETVDVIIMTAENQHFRCNKQEKEESFMAVVVKKKKARRRRRMTTFQSCFNLSVCILIVVVLVIAPCCKAEADDGLLEVFNRMASNLMT